MKKYRYTMLRANISNHDFIELNDIDTVLESSDIVAILVAHKQFKN